MMLGKYNQSKTVKFSLVAPDGVDLITAATFAAGDIKISKDEGAEVDTTNLPTDEGSGYSLVLTATEMSAARISLYIIDQTATKIWLDIPVEIETYGNASAEHAFDLDTATVALSATGLDAISSAATGMVEIAKAIWDRVLSGATHNIATSAGRRLRGIQEFQGYENGAVWIDTVNGVAGTVDYENGTVESKVLTLADAITIASSLSINKFEVSNDSSITFTEAHTSESWAGNGWTLALGGQNISESHINHCNDVSGAGTAAAGECHIVDSHIANSVACTLGQAHLTRCSIGAGGLVLSQAANYTIDDCSSGIAGAAAPTIDMGAAVGATNLSVRKWSGGLTLNNLAAGDVVTLEGVFGSITLNGADAQVEIRGIAKEVINNLTGSPTANDNSIKSTNLITVDGIWDEPLTGGTHNVANSSGKRIRDLQEWGSYEGGAIFIDTVNGAAGTTDYESGTILNPVDTIADANTVAGSLGLSRFEVAPNSSIIFAASQISQVLKGIGWSLAFGGQNISDSQIIGAQSVSGTATTPTGEAHFSDCEFVSGTIGQSHFKFCGFAGTLTLSAAANYTMSDCYSQIPGSPTPIIDFGAVVGNTGLSMRRYSGGIEVQNYGATGIDAMSLEGDGQLVIAASCIGGTIYIRGNFKVTDNSGGAVTIVYDDNTTNAIAILEDTGATIPAQINNLNDPTAAAVAAAVASFDMGNGRTIEEALAFLRNKWTIIAGVLTVYNTDDVTVLWTAPVTTTAGDPVSGIDPG